jgi:LDH2 family malate/lactate/ureidoglycolate dehydrogenase
VRAVRKSEVIPSASPELLRETAVSALVDGGWGFGQVTIDRATRLVIDKTRDHGVAVVAAVRCTHIGRLGEYAEMGAAEGVVLFLATGGLAPRKGGHVAPFGGRTGVLGTNPLAFGFPGGDQAPVVLADFATSAVAAGKIGVARAKGEPLPPGTILDRHGRPTTRAEDYYAGGTLQPFGGHKGYALGVIVELLGRVLTGSETFAEPEAGRGGDVYGRSGTLLVGIDPGLFRVPADYARDVDDTVAQLKAVAPAEGFSEVLVPGEPERRARTERERAGIAVEEPTLEAIREVARSLDVDVSL